MVNVDEATVAKLMREGKNFEILVDCEKAISFREGKLKNLNEVLATDEIFKDVKKGELASEHELQNIFKTINPEAIAREIIKHGEIYLTADYKNKEREQKKKRIVDIIKINAINPQTGLPHPAERIESAIEQAKIQINEHKKAEEQVQDIVKKLKVLLPLRFEIRQLHIIVPARYSGQSYNILNKFGKLLKDEWLGNGSLSAVLEIPAGLQEDFESSMNSLTHGEAEIKIIKTQ
ncbi:MAG: ribosome assembly factor SBDS [Candidatus Nanoarchaeia archaeon]|nr:ribosome assembly factor SBDS [Candidatus Nanoarchaeia archaeon]